MGNVDCTVLCERPKLAPHREAMRARIAGLLGLDTGAVGMKFTTMEGLGPIGAAEAIACPRRGAPGVRMRLHNTMTGKVEELVPLEAGKVRMYNCGPTVYKRNTVGNFRAYVMADLLRRALEHLGYEVTQVMNITDVGHLTEDDVADARGEDKLQKEARERNVDPWQIAREAEEWFHEDRKVLRVKDAHHYPRATEHIEEMKAIISGLIDSGHAYAVDGNVYFAVESFADYGALSGNTVEKLEAGASGRVEERSDKRNPNDFALWKHDRKHLMQWDSPWGRGYPGWHIECSAMSHKYLGETLRYPHGRAGQHLPAPRVRDRAERVDSPSKPFARHWVHCGWLDDRAAAR